MSKKLFVSQMAMVFVALQAGLGLAMNPDTGPGCGLGKVAWAEFKHPKNIVPQLLMSTTNNTILPWQAFGISSGTMGCTNDGVVWAEHKATMFASLNFENLSQDMARGQGEHLTALATLMGVPAEQQPAFFALTQEKYAMLIQAGETSPAAMIRALNDAMASHAVLAKAGASR